MVALLASGEARAQEIRAPQRQPAQPAPQQPAQPTVGAQSEGWLGDMLFLEFAGGYGFQLGETEYLPDGAPDDFKHPIVHGWSTGGSIGYIFTPLLAVFANYEYTRARSRKGELPMVLDEVEGRIDYHTITAGLRLYAPVGFGRFRAELGLGVALPYDKRLHFDYAPPLEQVGITGSGRRKQNFDVGYGGHGALGYEFPVWGPIYAGAQLKLKLFQSNNDGETTELDNFVRDFEESPPTAVDATIDHGDGEAMPTTDSIQEGRLQLFIGARL